MKMPQPRWEVRVAGHVADAELGPEIREIVRAELECMTVLSASFADQAALHGFLHRLLDCGFEVVDVRRVPDTEH
jgi:hypothetical protein